MQGKAPQTQINHSPLVQCRHAPREWKTIACVLVRVKLWQTKFSYVKARSCHHHQNGTCSKSESQQIAQGAPNDWCTRRAVSFAYPPYGFKKRRRYNTKPRYAKVLHESEAHMRQSTSEINETATCVTGSLSPGTTRRLDEKRMTSVRCA